MAEVAGIETILKLLRESFAPDSYPPDPLPPIPQTRVCAPAQITDDFSNTRKCVTCGLIVAPTEESHHAEWHAALMLMDRRLRAIEAGLNRLSRHLTAGNISLADLVGIEEAERADVPLDPRFVRNESRVTIPTS